MDRFDAMQAFVRVVEAGSFTKAAHTLHMSRATVTQLVQQLEARLRVKLLNRTTRQVNVTADGAAYYERVVRLLAELDDVETGLPGAAAAPQGVLRVDVPSPLATTILIPALPGFYERYPDIVLDLGASDRKVDLISDNVDCVIRGGQLADQSLVARHLGDLQLGVYAAPAYLARVGMPAHPRELGDGSHRIVAYRWSAGADGFPYAMHRAGERQPVQGRHLLRIDDGNAYLAAGVAGLGVLWLPQYMARAHVTAGALVPLFEDWHVDPMPLYLAYRPTPYVSKTLRAFIDWVVELVAARGAIAPSSHRPPRSPRR
ncbi:DNA-binding transcriptional LysR family regulator [Pseudoduganella flava]|uniref:DNA-binding transcriptional LysR family regulator n=1 Tax=Pseudoduganella flava TaxID=871742 RepID=A0A562Q063_9BURK|nr:LysR family transcriptional regulator [Pseudoduganella flava]QGZ38416.1 LysR family transcriptional regulator [Pseudoduganella flava]TWI50038.1 DNA-binding transcriptional LysR family regulator [Pseudoduganella flava]